MTDSTQDLWHLARELQPKLIGHFLAAVDNSTISRAAEVMHVTQPALSKSIKQLEDRLGVQLFERWAKGVKLTQYGEILARRARLIERELSFAITELTARKGGASGHLRVGAGLIWSQKYLPRVIAKFQASYPGIKIELRTGVINTLVPMLQEGELDLICVTLDFPDSEDLVKEHLVDVRHSLFARSGHPLTNKRNVRAADLQAYRWVVLKDDYVGHSRLGSFFAANGLGPPTVAIELVADLSVLAVLADSDYLGSLPISIERMARSLGVVPIPMNNARLWASAAGVAYRRSSYPTPALNNFVTMLKESLVSKRRNSMLA